MGEYQYTHNKKTDTMSCNKKKSKWVELYFTQRKGITNVYTNVALLASSKFQFKITMECHSTFIRMTKNKKTQETYCWRGCEAPGAHTLWEALCIVDRHPFEKCYHLKFEPTHIQWLNIGRSEIHSYVLKRQVQDHAWEMWTRMFSFIRNKWKLEKIQVSFCTKIDKWYIHRITFYISKYTAREIMGTEP